MRCIEIRGAAERQDRHKSINRNMRCIEIKIIRRPEYEKTLINRNMRCIEIKDGAFRTCAKSAD